VTKRSARLTSLADVAARAEVSITTASRVLSGSQHPVAEATRARVLEAAAELDFEPNLLARGLVMQRTHIVAVLVPDLTDEFYARMVSGIDAAAFENGFSVVVCETERDADREMAYVRRLRSQRVDAIFYTDSSAADAERPQELVEQLRRVEAAGTVLLHLAPNFTVLPDVSYSMREGLGLLVDHLVALGHHDFVYVSAPSSLNSTKVARYALREVLARHEIELSEDRVLEGDGTRAAGLDAAKRIVEHGIEATAVLAATDHAAAGVLQGLEAHGIEVPGRMSVAGFGDITLAADVGLTTVHVPLVELGSNVMRRAIWILGGGKRMARDTMPLDLVVRRSTGPARA